MFFFSRQVPYHTCSVDVIFPSTPLDRRTDNEIIPYGGVWTKRPSASAFIATTVSHECWKICDRSLGGCSVWNLSWNLWMRMLNEATGTSIVWMMHGGNTDIMDRTSSEKNSIFFSFFFFFRVFDITFFFAVLFLLFFCLVFLFWFRFLSFLKIKQRYWQKPNAIFTRGLLIEWRSLKFSMWECAKQLRLLQKFYRKTTWVMYPFSIFSVELMFDVWLLILVMLREKQKTNQITNLQSFAVWSEIRKEFDAIELKLWSFCFSG